MEIFAILNNLYTNSKSLWIQELEDNEIEPFLINRWLAMNDGLRVQARWLDKYVFSLPNKMWLSLAWSVIPKVSKAPFIKYIKKIEDDTKWDFILKRVRKHFEMSDNDFRYNKNRIIKAIENDKKNWFSFYGIEKAYWKEHYIDFNYMKTFNIVKKSQGLDKWGL
jgi:hypothetical protein